MASNKLASAAFPEGTTSQLHIAAVTPLSVSPASVDRGSNMWKAASSTLVTPHGGQLLKLVAPPNRTQTHQRAAIGCLLGTKVLARLNFEHVPQNHFEDSSPRNKKSTGHSDCKADESRLSRNLPHFLICSFAHLTWKPIGDRVRSTGFHVESNRRLFASWLRCAQEGGEMCKRR